MAFPCVAIVGRPNVGKSSLFNWLAGKRISIVDPTAGVTRDRISTLIDGGNRYFELIDTGGVGIVDVDQLAAHVERQIAEAMDLADAIIFLVDARDGVMPLDEEVAKRLRVMGKPVLLVANKCDHEALDLHANEFFSLGFPKIVCVSAQQKRNKAHLIAWLMNNLPKEGKEKPQKETLKLAIVGKRNTGKSTFINALAQEERVIVSEVPGTTRDSVDVRFERDNQVFIGIDTAGVRKKRSVKGDIEFYSMARAERSIRRADVVLLFLEAGQKISRVDKKLAEYILQFHKPAIFVVNKWDLMAARGMVTGEIAEYVKKTFSSLDFVPIAFVTAKTGRNAFAVLNLAQNLFKQAQVRLSTKELTGAIQEAMAVTPPPMRQNRTPRIYFATQVDACPPTLVLFTNGPRLLDPPYIRFLTRQIRDHLAFGEVPIRLLLRGRRKGPTWKDDEEVGQEELEEAIQAVEVQPEKKSKKNVPKVEEWIQPKAAKSKAAKPDADKPDADKPDADKPKRKKPLRKKNRLWKNM
ncbi:MAG: ribosome biogenesis GTPase Der [Gemmataceae bacterium]|nr:ribosome biogenesis GTPase Der [Gemmataceae bacterium]